MIKETLSNPPNISLLECISDKPTINNVKVYSYLQKSKTLSDFNK